MLIVDKRTALAIPPLLRLGFRPFFLLGSLLAVLAIPLWIVAWLGGWHSLQPEGGWLAWHRHEMAFGFAGAIIAGFLLTAVQNWTGRPGLSGRPLGALVALWLLARAAWWQPWTPLLLFSNLAFFAAVAAVMARQLWAVKQTRNYPIVGVLLLLGLVDGLSLVGVQMQDDGLQRQGVLAAVWLVAAMMGLIGGRVIPFFTQRGLGRVQQVPAWEWLDQSLLLGSVLIALLHAAGLALRPGLLLAALFALLALGHGIRLARWFDKDLLRVPLLWSLHLAYAWLVLACAGMALWHLGLLDTPSPALHGLTIGAMGGLILGMLARVSLGHTGRPLELPQGFALAFVLLNLGAMLRVFGIGIHYSLALGLAAALWTGAFALYLYRYGPMLCRTRADGHPG
ncbi:uncharacterized protein involved in response to NO [Pseudomonas fluvialis]|uniref:Uncharacterized protein involved in response to NO n=1 Tax=Pseudomonas fluvialis TaxID=1793966 RepID=A0A7X0EV54_9PSED|nr:NnrS family protein [Pseudomonas fluvialis]MBB6342889.1 uncharacterized protein involved in response to NO [Pseudomonas fluvialis]